MKSRSIATPLKPPVGAALNHALLQ